MNDEARRKRNMEMFDHDLSILMSDLRGMQAHYQIEDWEAYVLLRKPNCAESYVLKYEGQEDFAKQIVALHAAPEPARGVEGQGETETYRRNAIRNFRWAYQLLLALAKRKLAEANTNLADPNEWPAGQQWHEMNGTSHSIFLRQAREEAGLPHEAFLALIRAGEYDVDDLYEQAATTPPPPVEKCVKCGKPISRAWKYCRYCDAKITPA